MKTFPKDILQQANNAMDYAHSGNVLLFKNETGWLVSTRNKMIFVPKKYIDYILTEQYIIFFESDVKKNKKIFYYE